MRRTGSLFPAQGEKRSPDPTLPAILFLVFPSPPGIIWYKLCLQQRQTSLLPSILFKKKKKKIFFSPLLCPTKLSTLPKLCFPPGKSAWSFFASFPSDGSQLVTVPPRWPRREAGEGRCLRCRSSLCRGCPRRDSPVWCHSRWCACPCRGCCRWRGRWCGPRTPLWRGKG